MTEEERLKYLEEATKFINRYKRKFQLNKDDIQDIKIKFWSNYKDDKGCSPDTFVKMLIDNHNVTKWRKQASPKYAHKPIYLDKVDGYYSEDRMDWLENLIAPDFDGFEFEDEQVSEIINSRLSDKMKEILTDNEEFVIRELFYNERSVVDISTELNTSKQNIYLIKNRALKKLSNFMTL